MTTSPPARLRNRRSAPHKPRARNAWVLVELGRSKIECDQIYPTRKAADAESRDYEYAVRVRITPLTKKKGKAK